MPYDTSTPDAAKTKPPLKTRDGVSKLRKVSLASPGTHQGRAGHKAHGTPVFDAGPTTRETQKALAGQQVETHKRSAGHCPRETRRPLAGRSHRETQSVTAGPEPDETRVTRAGQIALETQSTDAGHVFRVTPVAPAGIGDREHHETRNCDAADTPAIVAKIVELQKIRRFCIKAQSQMNRSIEALIAGTLGYTNDHTEADRKAIFKQAANIRKLVEKKGLDGLDGTATHASHAIKPFAELIPLNAAAREPWDQKRQQVEHLMVEHSAKLHVADWATSIAGFGLLNLAIIVGEAGVPIELFRTVSCLWKRLGLAVIEGERQRKKTDPEEAEKQGYSPRRRSEAFVVGSISVFLAQRPGMRYRDIYDRRRAHTLSRIAATADLPAGGGQKWFAGRCDKDARRVMTKALIADLYGAWTGKPRPIAWLEPRERMA